MPLTYTRQARTRSARPSRTAAPTVFTRGPRELQRSLLGPPAQPYGEVPPWFPGTLPEWACFWAHLKLGLRPDGPLAAPAEAYLSGPGAAGWFTYQASFAGGHKVTGGVVPDFLEGDVPVAINVQSEYIHYRRGTRVLMRDLATRDVLARYGIQLVYIDDVDCLSDPIGAVKEARRGIDRSYTARPR